MTKAEKNVVWINGSLYGIAVGTGVFTLGLLYTMWSMYQ